jgi:hypothetical protein
MYDLNITTNEDIAKKYEKSTFSIEDIQADIYEITVDGEFAGFIAYTVEMVPELGWTLYVEAVELLPEFQGNGLYRQICADLMESEEVDAIAGENKGAKGVEYKGIIIGGARVFSLWVRFNNQD